MVCFKPMGDCGIPDNQTMFAASDFLQIDHLILPYACMGVPEEGIPMDWPSLPRLTQLLASMDAMHEATGDEYQLSPPHERALATALGLAPATEALPDGLLPWAAWRAGLNNRACAWFTPCHWSTGSDQVRLQPPDELDLKDEESRALFEALSPWAAEDGITLVWETAQRWRAESEVFAAMPWASLDRVAHRRVDAWLPDSSQCPQAAGLLRLMNEAQMLFYTHPVNDLRSANGLATINGFWISGCGIWNQGNPAGDSSRIQLENALRPAALRGDRTGWIQDWEQLDSSLISVLVEQVQQKKPLRLTLCGERSFQTWVTPAPELALPWRQRLARTWRSRRSPTAAAILGKL